MWIWKIVDQYIHKVLLAYSTDANEGVLIQFEYIFFHEKDKTTFYENIRAICSLNPLFPVKTKTRLLWLFFKILFKCILFSHSPNSLCSKVFKILRSNSYNKIHDLLKFSPPK